jgi:hypothetical protein
MEIDVVSYYSSKKNVFNGANLFITVKYYRLQKSVQNYFTAGLHEGFTMGEV